jgi:hypothetical protein
MSLRTANFLTLGGFSVLYCGIMGILMAINVPADSHARKLAALVLGLVALAGLTVMSVGRLMKVDGGGDRRDPATPRIEDP